MPDIERHWPLPVLMLSMAVSTVGDVVPLGALRFTTVWLLSLPEVISHLTSIVDDQSSLLK